MVGALGYATRSTELLGRCVAMNHQDWVREADGGKTDHRRNDKEDFAKAEGLNAD